MEQKHPDHHEDFYHSTSEDMLHGEGYGVHLLIWFALVALTGVTVAIAGVHLQELTLTVAMLVASAKVFLVMYYFMHLKYEPLFLRMMILVCFITFTVFVVLTFFDISFR